MPSLITSNATSTVPRIKSSSAAAALPAALTPTLATGDGTAIATPVADAIADSMAQNTKTAYRHHLRLWAAWLKQTARDPNHVTAHDIAQYLTALQTAGSGKSKLDQANAALTKLYPTKTKSQLVRETLRGLRRRIGAAPKQATALTKQIADQIADTLTNTPRDQRTLALIVLMRDGMLRISEAHALNRADISAPDSDGLAYITIHRSKTDQEGEGTELLISPRTHRAVKRWMDCAPDLPATAPLFLGLTRQGALPSAPARLTIRQLTNLIKTAGHAIGINISGHSARVGMAQDLSADGISTSAIMNAGRWAEPRMVALYTRRQRASRGAIARYYRLNQ